MTDFNVGDRVYLVDEGLGQPRRIEHDHQGADPALPRGTVSIVFEDLDVWVVDFDPPYRFRNGRWAKWEDDDT